MSLARRSLTSISWNSLSSISATLVSFLRGVLLARMLAVEVFGIYAGMRAVVEISITLTDFGLTGAFLHRVPETENEAQAASVHFVIKVILLSIWTFILLAGIALWAEKDIKLPFSIVVITTGIRHLTLTGQAVLLRRVDHKRLASMNLVNAVLLSFVVVVLAYRGYGLWSIVIGDILACIIWVFGIYVWKPVWHINFSWYADIGRYYLDYGRRAFAAVTLASLLDRIDDLWTRYVLGETAMGYYSRAYRFATYPRLVLANPITYVIGGTYAELKSDRLGLSRAFFRTNAFLIRSSFLIGGILTLIAPEFIKILLTEKWMPMLDVFRLMLVFTLLDPLKLGLADLLIAVGKPEIVVRTRLIQFCVLVFGLVILSTPYGISGVAVAVDIMLCVGIVMLFHQTKPFVDFSWVKLFLRPGMGLSLGIIITLFWMYWLGPIESDWISGAAKFLSFSVTYIGFLLITERDQILNMVGMLSESLSRN